MNEMEMERYTSQRWRPTDDQVQMMTHIYNYGVTHPSRAQVVEIASRLKAFADATEYNVHCWFNNHGNRLQASFTPHGSKEVQQRLAPPTPEEASNVGEKQAGDSPWVASKKENHMKKLGGFHSSMHSSHLEERNKRSGTHDYSSKPSSIHTSHGHGRALAKRSQYMALEEGEASIEENHPATVSKELE
ncbi:hypothetical protein LR48_Vigan05g164000 [Vigna angularis]|uniref:Homeobox domain-containing protein n=1 Tax=Phaseolus angularis TaxID=3914 RepID=A0A0L9UMC6_PHAAN|nr:hypothetical protein LR48_Vigan05g164000 [Vigna angularis]